MKYCNMMKLATAGCLAMGTMALAEPAPSGGPANQTNNAADRASGRDPGSQDTSQRKPGDPTLVDSARTTASGAAANAGSDITIQQQLAAIARTPETAGDKLFVLDAALGNQWEVEFSKVVAERAQNDQVKMAAQHLINDHTAAQQKLTPIAQKMGLQLPSSLPSMKQQKLEIFRSMPVEKLETCFVVDTRAAHAKDISSYADHAKTVQDEQLKAYVVETLPKLQQHAQHIQTAAAAKGLPGGMAGSDAPRTGGQLPTGRTE